MAVCGWGALSRPYIHFELEEPTSSLDACLGFDSLFGQRVFTAHSLFEPQKDWGERVGRASFCLRNPEPYTSSRRIQNQGRAQHSQSERDYIEDAARLTILESDYYGTGRVPWNGMFVLKHRWQLHETPEK